MPHHHLMVKMDRKDQNSGQKKSLGAKINFQKVKRPKP